MHTVARTRAAHGLRTSVHANTLPLLTLGLDRRVAQRQHFPAARRALQTFLILLPRVRGLQRTKGRLRCPQWDTSAVRTRRSYQRSDADQAYPLLGGNLRSRSFLRVARCCLLAHQGLALAA